MSKQWNPDGGFPSPEQVERMVAAEVRHLAEAEYARQRGVEEKSESRRDRLRAAYRLQHREVGRKVNLDAVFALVGNVAALRPRHGSPCRRGQPGGLRRPRVSRDPLARRAERREEPARPRPPPRLAGGRFGIMSASTTLQRRPTMDTILVKVRLPCSAARLENALLKAAHNGHWHDAQVKVDEKGNLIVTYPDDSK